MLFNLRHCTIYNLQHDDSIVICTYYNDNNTTISTNTNTINTNTKIIIIRRIGRIYYFELFVISIF